MADRIIGWVAGKPVFALAGAAGAISFFIDDGDGDEPDGSDAVGDPDDDEDEDEDDGDEDGDTGSDDGDTITIKRSELEALRGQLGKANKEARWRREALRGMGIGRNGKPLTGETEDRGDAGGDQDPGESAPKDRAALVREVQQEVEAELGEDTNAHTESGSEADRLRAALLNVGVARALQEQGWVGKSHGPALRLLDLNKVTVTVTDANEVEFGGLTDQIDALKQDLPTLFKAREAPAPTRRARPRGGVAAVDGAERPGDAQSRARKSWKEQIGTQLATGRHPGR